MVTKVIKTASPGVPLDIADLTTVELEGAGVFDRMLTLHRLALTREFTGGRIVGKEYSDTFTKTYIANLELSIRLVMEKEKQAYDIELQEAQIKKMEAEAELSLKQLELMIAKMPHEIRLMIATADKMVADAALAEKQLILADKELLIKDKELLLKDKELDLLAQQILLTIQKVVTEKAQTDPTVIKDGSVISMNNKVLAAQVDGFKRDAEQKVANTMLQTWIVRLNNDSALTNSQNKLDDSYIGQAVTKMLTGIGA